mmetsp:Transcript_15430/g.31717  ORF Transcript_15430/g.31717 Transcript_15430/m.31717 type:complete len:137 (-) Transcript_15430:394-804(-)
MSPVELTGLRAQAAELPSYGGLAVTIESTGNLARDHLANERTFLAWIRTALAILTLGLALAKFDPTENGVLSGSCFIILSMVLLYYSRIRYDEVSGALYRGEYLVLRKGAGILVVLLAVVAVMCTIVIFRQDQALH